MKESERNILNLLRETTLSAMPESDFQYIEKAVEQQGLMGLVGSAQVTIALAVAKFNDNHDDKGRFATGAGSSTGTMPRATPSTASPNGTSGRFSNEGMIAHAEQMFGTGSKEHLQAIQRFRTPKVNPNVITPSNHGVKTNLDEKQQRTINRVISPAGDYLIRPKPFGGIQFAQTWVKAGEPQIRGYGVST